jgi:glycosyltransferase involved in cell wall biosynthesis
MDRISSDVLTTGPEQSPGDHVVHLVGRLTDAVFSFLGPVTAVHAERGIRQTVILLDEPSHRHLLPRFHPSIQLVPTPADVGPLQRLRATYEALLEAVATQDTVAVHLHGAIPGVLGVCVARFKGMPQGLIFSPHGSRSLVAIGPVRGLATWLLRPPPGPASKLLIANSTADAKALQRLTDEPVQLIESRVDSEFFFVPRREARRPLLLTGSRTRGSTAPALYAQLAVLLGEESLRVSCNWHGTADTNSLARLAAANVAVYDATDTSERASRMSSAWIYVALAGERGFPVFLAEAMAAGLPCVAWDTPAHRELIRHGETGLCCDSLQTLLACVAELIDSPVRRARLGTAAHSEARRRFNDETFRDSINSAFSSMLPEV